MVQIEDRSQFRQCLKEFSFTSYLTKIEIVKVLSKVRVECDRLVLANQSNTAVAPGNTTNVNAALNQGVALFVTNITKIVRLDEFEQMQMQSLQNVRVVLKDG
jgi:dynein heavy chain